MNQPRLREPHAPAKDLELLVEAERRLDGLLQAARADAAALLAEARQRAAALDAGWAAGFAAARRDLELRIVEERDRELARVRDEAERRISSGLTQSADQIETLAGWVVSQVRGPAAGETGS